MTLVLTLKAQPPQRLDLAPLVPNLLKDKSAKEIAAIDLATTKEPAKVGDIGFPMVVHPRDPNTCFVFPMDGTTVWPRRVGQMVAMAAPRGLPSLR